MSEAKEKDDDYKEVEEKSKDNKLLAIVAMNIGALCNCGTTATYRIIAPDYHAADFNFMKNTCGLVSGILICACLRMNPYSLFPGDKKYVQTVRLLSGQTNFVLLSIAAPLAPISLIMVFWQTSPFWISILAFYLLKEPILPIELAGMVICFGAVIVIASQQGNKSEDESSQDSLLGLGLVLIAGLIYPFCAITTRMLKEVPALIVSFWYMLGGLTLTLAFMTGKLMFTGQGTRLFEYTAYQNKVCLGAALFDTVAHFCYLVAYQADSSGFVALISFMTIVYAYICDQLFFNEILNAIELSAALSIMIVAISITVFKMKQQRKEKEIVGQELTEDRRTTA